MADAKPPERPPTPVSRRRARHRSPARRGPLRVLGALIARLLAVEDGRPAAVAAAPAMQLREILRRFWPYARPYRRWLVLAGAVIVVLPALDTATIWLWKLLVDQVLVPRRFGPFPLIVGAYAGLTVVGGAIGFIDDYLSTWLGERFLLDLRDTVFRHLQALSLSFFERRRLGDLVSRLTADLAAVETFVLSGVTDAASYLLRIVFYGAALFYLQWELALAALTVTPVFWIVARRFAALRKRAAREKRRRSGSVAAVAEETLSNIALVQAYGREEEGAAQLHREGTAALRAQLASARIKALYGPIVELLELAGGLTVIGLGVWLLSSGRITLGALLVFLVYLVELYGPIRGISRLTNSAFTAAAGAERIAELLDESPAIADRPGARPLPRARGAIELDAVTFRYPGAEREALREVSLRCDPGEMVALVGPSGAGKSTIAKLLVRFYDPCSGAVRLDGHDLRDLRVADVRRSVTLLLQEALLLDATVRENIAFGRPGVSDAQIELAARAAAADGFVAALPGGYDARIGQKGRALSGGQRQRIAIARAFVRDAPVLVLDEPAAGLDARATAAVLEPLRRVMQGRATVVIAHDLLTVRDADRILVLDRGAVVAEGTHEQLISECPLYSTLWRLHGAVHDSEAAVAL